MNHYKKNQLEIIIKTFFFMEIIGNRLGFVSSIGSGVTSAFCEPAKGIRYGPVCFFECAEEKRSGAVTKVFVCYFLFFC